MSMLNLSFVKFMILLGCISCELIIAMFHVFDVMMGCAEQVRRMRRTGSANSPNPFGTAMSVTPKRDRDDQSHFFSSTSTTTEHKRGQLLLGPSMGLGGRELAVWESEVMNRE